MTNTTQARYYAATLYAVKLTTGEFIIKTTIAFSTYSVKELEHKWIIDAIKEWPTDSYFRHGVSICAETNSMREDFLKTLTISNQ